MTDSKEIAADQFFLGHERVWVSTYRLTPSYYQTMIFGPGIPPDISRLPLVSTTEQDAREDHRAVLAAYGYRKAGLRKWKFFRAAENIGKGMVSIGRRPPGRKSAWIMAGTWTFALLIPLAYTAFGGLDLSRWSGWSNLLVGSFDAYMLYNSIMGLLWIYHIPGQGRRRATENPPGRGSTRE